MADPSKALRTQASAKRAVLCVCTRCAADPGPGLKGRMITARQRRTHEQRQALAGPATAVRGRAYANARFRRGDDLGLAQNYLRNMSQAGPSISQLNFKTSGGLGKAMDESEETIARLEPPGPAAAPGNDIVAAVGADFMDLDALQAPEDERAGDNGAWRAPSSTKSRVVIQAEIQSFSRRREIMRRCR
ncbi:hypothetical protein K439DRAFT_1189177 [Ramaria rubella]|nr:hypothetical protein K439DRAFT_1189177 [Ramaria rubella]